MVSNMNKLIHNTSTGEIIVRDFTEQELTEYKAEQVRLEQVAVEAAVKEAERQALLNKLGITAEDIAALGL